MADLRVGGLARLSTCDWPGELAATIFCQGCPWDCPYCHNPHLRAAKNEPKLAWPDVLAFLDKRRGLLDAVVFSGGEPTAQAVLPNAIQTVRAMGFRVGLHSAGPYPERLAAVLPWLDWVGFDVKAPFDRYERITGTPGSGDKALGSLRRLLDSGVDYEVRTTVHSALLDQDDILRLTEQLLSLGVRHYAVQAFRTDGTRPDRVEQTQEEAPDLPQDRKECFDDYHVR